MLTTLDNLGRVTSITGPNEYNLADTNAYTIKFEYYPHRMTKDANGNIQNPAYARTLHYDPTIAGNNIITTSFVDGFGRPVQVKKTGFVNGSKTLIVSGMMKYDALGRPVESYYPKTNAVDSVYDPLPNNSQSPTRTWYDAFDRVTKTILPDGSTTEMTYDIAGGYLKTTVKDALQHIQETYTNGSGLTVRTTQYAKANEPINTYFAYDPINQLIEVTDAKGKKTISEYDNAGRRISVTHPASGKTTFEYDAAGNLIAKQTANLRKKGADHKIRYVYTYNRLDTIHYPDHPENDVVYTYGSASDNSGFNRKGRLVSLTDGSGAQEFKYGKMGEVTEVRRTLVIPNQAVATYTTKTEYDSWNRLLKMTYPDGEEVKYSYNVAGLLNKVIGEKPGFASTNYVTDIKYDEFEQRSYIKYGNGTETNYTYKPENRLLNTLSVQKGSTMLMNNAYTYDEVQNITDIVNSGDPNNTIGGKMTHHYSYDNLYRLDSASGDFIGYNGKKARYHLAMEYDNMHNITRKKQDVVQNGIKFGGILNAGYDLLYKYADNSQQIANIAEQSYRVERASQATYQAGSQAGDAISNKTQTFAYDANGNMTFIATGKLQSDSTLQATSTRKMLWDEENRLLAVSDNGFISNYWYDASGERTVKESFDNEGVYVNGVLSGARTGTGKFTAYVSPYLVVNNGGYYSKHIYIGSQRITSKLGSSEIFNDTVNPVSPTNPHNLTMAAKLSTQNGKIQSRCDSLGVIYRGTSQGSVGFITSIAGRITAPQLYFYHPDHLGSSSLITDNNGTLVQHLEYLPFGEVFVEENKSLWSTPFKFSSKEQDEETGLHYFGARYYDSRLGVWLSVDPLAEKKPFLSSYVYCRNNPINMIDPDGMDEYEVSHNGRTIKVAENKEKDIVYSLNKKGERVSSSEYEYNTIKLSSVKENNDNYYIIQLKGDDKAQKLFEFLTTPENFELKSGQNVEWSRTLTGEKGESGLNFITTSQDLDGDKAGTYLFENQLKNGYTIRGHDHNHPNNDPNPSGTGGKGGDIEYMKYLNRKGKVSPNAQFRIFTPGLKNRYHTYNVNSTVNLRQVNIVAKKIK